MFQVALLALLSACANAQFPGFGNQMQQMQQMQRAPQMGRFLPNQMGAFMNLHQHGNSVTINCDQGNKMCAGQTLTCLHEACKYECHEVGSCAGTRFISSPLTKDLDIQCTKPNACKGIKVLSGAVNTKLQCDDHACIGIKLYCKSSAADVCELKCQSDGCIAQVMGGLPGGMAPQIPSFPGFPPRSRTPIGPIGQQAFANEVFCEGRIRECNVIASSDYAFLFGRLTCKVAFGGQCLLECADSWGEVSCRGAKYLCHTNPMACRCTDQRHSNTFGIAPVRRLPGSDCPKLTFPKKKKPAAPKKSAPKKKGGKAAPTTTASATKAGPTTTRV